VITAFFAFVAMTLVFVAVVFFDWFTAEIPSPADSPANSSTTGVSFWLFVSCYEPLDTDDRSTCINYNLPFSCNTDSHTACLYVQTLRAGLLISGAACVVVFTISLFNLCCARDSCISVINLVLSLLGCCGMVTAIPVVVIMRSNLAGLVATGYNADSLHDVAFGYSFYLSLIAAFYNANLLIVAFIRVVVGLGNRNPSPQQQEPHQQHKQPPLQTQQPKKKQRSGYFPLQSEPEPTQCVYAAQTYANIEGNASDDDLLYLHGSFDWQPRLSEKQFLAGDDSIANVAAVATQPMYHKPPTVEKQSLPAVNVAAEKVEPVKFCPECRTPAFTEAKFCTVCWPKKNHFWLIPTAAPAQDTESSA
jgi:hypothetical protein